MDNQSTPQDQLQRQQLRDRLGKLADVLDTAWRIPGTRIRFGADALIGLIPVAGDVVGVGMGLWMIWQARSVQAPARLQGKMLLNLGIEALVGVVPLVGDAFDVLWQANQRNRKVLLSWMDEQDQMDDPTPKRRWLKWLLAGSAIVALGLWVTQR